MSSSRIETRELTALFIKRNKNLEATTLNKFDSIKRAFQVNPPKYLKEMKITLDDALKVHHMIYLDDFDGITDIINQYPPTDDCTELTANMKRSKATFLNIDFGRLPVI
jgi:hypothetical protein